MKPTSSHLASFRLTSRAILLVVAAAVLTLQYQLLQCPSLESFDSHPLLSEMKSQLQQQPQAPLSMPNDPWQIWKLQPRASSDDEQPFWHSSSSPQTKKRPLNLVHIAKNGGSSIVQAAIDANLTWGDCLFQQQWPGRNCPLPPVQQWPTDDPTGWGRVWWHLPLQQLPLTELSESSNNTIRYTNPYANYDLFAVVRNPYDRAVSEFYYHCGRFPNLCKGLDGKRAARVLNRNIQKAIKLQLLAVKTTEDYYFHEGHWIPQYDFFVHDPKGIRKIEHLLHLETLEQEFPSLMKAYGLSSTVRLPPQPVKPRSNHNSNHQPKMSVLNLTLATVKLIEVVYEKDFELGSYEMMSSKWGQYLQEAASVAAAAK